MEVRFKADVMLIEAAQADAMLRNTLEEAGELGSSGYHPQMRACHERNADLLEQYVAQYGWPLPSYNDQVYHAAWLIAIHAISRPLLLKQARAVLEAALAAGEPVGPEYARLVDRIELYEGRSQWYGTQFFPSPQGWYVRDLAEQKTVDSRRAMVGLPPLAQIQQEYTTLPGGVISEADMINYERAWQHFLQEVGWQ